MAVNALGLVHRTVRNEKEDKEQILHNIQNESWKDWPNQAGVSRPFARVALLETPWLFGG